MSGVGGEPLRRDHDSVGSLIKRRYFIRALGATVIRFRVIGEAARVHYNDTTASRRSKLLEGSVGRGYA